MKALIGLVTFGLLAACGPMPNSAEARRQADANEGAATTDAKAAETITLPEFEQIKTGMSYAQVVAIVGFDGTEQSSNEFGGTKTIMYAWSNPDASNANAMFQNDRLVTKAQFGLR
jgi:hypothetical protein